jgi:signal transduction histidine kinase/CheY-like chemotaxis protein
MSVLQAEALRAERDLRVEMANLRREGIPALLAGLLATSWLWSSLRFVRQGVIVLGALAWAVYGLRERHLPLACWLLVFDMVLIGILVVSAQPTALTLAFGCPIIIIASALLGNWQALLTATLLGGLVLLGYPHLPLAGSPELNPFNILILYYLTCATSWLVLRPLRMAMGYALSGWDRARLALEEVQQRRAELYRAVRALEETTARMERLNNELVVAQREAETARALKARFAATASHELRGPLNLILGFSRLMALSPERYGVPLPAPYRADVDAVYRNSQHLVALVDDILDMSHIEAERLPLVKDTVDLHEDVVRKAVSIVLPLAERKGLTVRTQLADNLPTLIVDPVRLRQALLNLLTNAIRVTTQGSITLRTEQVDACVHVSVEDTGPGIPAEDIPRLFREFSQVHMAETRAESGTGLGLSISKHLIELHGGHIWVESTLGVGTVFHFTVPLPGTQPQVMGEVRTATTTPRRVFNTCLVVHRDPRIIRLLARYIENYRIVGLPDETQVRAITEELHPRAVLAPTELGPLVAEQLQGVAGDVPLITCGMPELSGHFALEGVVAYLVKPILQDTVVTVMQKVAVQEGETCVLLVDDDPDAIRLIERMLTAVPHPYRIVKAYSGERALEIMEKLVPDVIFLDLVMPGLDGRQVLEQMRADERLSQVPVVIISARDWVEESNAITAPIALHRRDALDIAGGIRCLRALLDAQQPRYLNPE